MYEKKRLHPISIFFQVFNWLKASFFLIIIAFVSFDFFYVVLGVSAYLVFLIIVASLSWSRFTYSVDEDGLTIAYGLIKRTNRTISKHRIQSIDLTETIVHRLFKLVGVQIETATTGLQAEAQLSAVRLDEGYTLRKQLKQIKSEVDEELEDGEEVVTPEVPKRVATNRELLLFGVTSGGIGIILGSLAVLFSEVAEYVPDSIYDTTWEWIIATSILAIIVLVALFLILVWVISVGFTFIRYGKFTIKKQGDELLISRGLLERKQLTIPLGRIQAVGVEENIFRQPFGYVSVFAEIAGGSADNQSSGSAVLFPIMKKKEIHAFLDTFVPGIEWDEEVSWVQTPRVARKYYLFRSLIIPVVGLVVLLYFYASLIWVALLILVIGLIFGFLRYQDTAFALKDDKLLLRFRMFTRVTVQIPKRRIQALEESQHMIQRRDQIATVYPSIISQVGGKRFSLKELRTTDIDELVNWYSKREDIRK